MKLGVDEQRKRRKRRIRECYEFVCCGVQRNEWRAWRKQTEREEDGIEFHTNATLGPSKTRQTIPYVPGTWAPN